MAHTLATAAKTAHDCETILTAVLGRIESLESAIHHKSKPELLIELTSRIYGEIVLARNSLQRVNHPVEDGDPLTILD